MRFEKWQALGNDYMIVERDELSFELTPARVRRLCEPHFGVFADGVLLLSPPSDPAHVADLRIFNPDGSEAELSGNGAREAILYLRRRGWTDRDTFSIHTAAGTITPQITGPFTCRVDMGLASLASRDFPGGPPDGAAELRVEPDEQAGQPGTWSVQHISIGNPQCSIRVADVEALQALDLPAIGPALEGHPEFPNRTNVSWYVELDAGPPVRLRARIFERGVGETLSSGTGASGAAVAYLVTGANGRAPGPPRQRTSVIVELDGGELEVEVDEQLRVHLSGWALPVFAGSLSKELVEELREL
ncbi:MAG TPA: diaminopimelate epimerase [Solirubrobacteraceae bacterium]|jgi:diaminopimelate epimerase|nr:diaminopimelate epimerase [Solirubrobacteraceae bacterium]